MTSKLKYHKNYTEFGDPYRLVLPLNLEDLVHMYLSRKIETAYRRDINFMWLPARQKISLFD